MTEEEAKALTKDELDRIWTDYREYWKEPKKFLIRKGHMDGKIRCPFCDNEMEYDRIRHPIFTPEGMIRTVYSCPFCVTVCQMDHVFTEEVSDERANEMADDAAYHSAQDELRKFMNGDAYRLYLTDCIEYREKHGTEMPIWYGICTDYSLMGKSEYAPKDHDEILKNRDDAIERGKTCTKEEIKAYIESRKTLRDMRERMKE